MIRPSTIADVPQLLALGPTIFANGAKAFGAFDANAWMAELWRLLNLKDRASFVAVDGDTIVGAHIVMLMAAFSMPSAITARVLTLWVSPLARGKGLATKLHASSEEWARAQGATLMLAGVPFDYEAHHDLGDASITADAAHGFYARQGYREAETQYFKELR